LRAFARDAKLTAALAVGVVELTVRLVKKCANFASPIRPNQHDGGGRYRSAIREILRRCGSE
jgi:hypothetical protein